MTSTSSATAGAVLSVDDMLANAKAAAAASAAGGDGTKSKVQQLLAAHGDNLTDTVELSPVAKLMAAKTAAAAKTDYTDSDDYITAKVAQLKSQIATYTNLPGLDPSGGVLDGLTKEVNDLVTKQQTKLKAATDAAAAKQKELDDKNKNAYQGISSDAMLKRAAQVATTGKVADSTTLSSAAQAMLDKVTGGNVDTTA